MYKSLVFVTALFTILSMAHAVTVDGFVYLSGRSDHGGIKVAFYAVSPSARSDSTYSGQTGDFEIGLAPGVYNVMYSHFDFATYPLPNQALLFATTLPPVTLLPPLSGSLSGPLGPGDLEVVDTISVDSGQALTILPGTRLFFDPLIAFVVHGLLIANGTNDDSILFTKRYPSPDSLWAGIQYQRADSSSQMAYVIVEYSGGHRGYYYLETQGVSSLSTRMTVSHCAVRLNRGGGISLNSSNVQINDCVVAANRCSDGTGGIGVAYGTLIVNNCTITSDSSDEYGAGGIYCRAATVSVRNSHISSNVGEYSGGFYCADSTNLELDSTAFDGNSSYEYGAALSTSGQHSIVSVTNCLFNGNVSYSGNQATAIWISDTSPTITHCSIVAGRSGYFVNASPAVNCNECGMTFNSCIVAYNRGNPDYGYPSAGIYVSSGSSPMITYCDIFGNDTAFGGRTPTAIGIIALTNARGDSCDTYYNIYRDPMFVDAAGGDYHLLANSPCIDAGDPSLPHDPDGSVADMGAFPFTPLGAGDHFILHPSALSLSSYPNPFNAVARLSFELPVSGSVSLKVYDVTGRLAATVFSGPMTAGKHELALDGSRLASGVYFARLEAGSLARTQKLVLLK